MQHDIYSLDVCFLKIEIWNSFVSYTQNDTVFTFNEIFDFHLKDFEFSTSLLMKDHLINFAKNKLFKLTEKIYEKVVINCLICLNKNNSNFENENEFQNNDDVLIEMKYIEKICHFRKCVERYKFMWS